MADTLALRLSHSWDGSNLADWADEHGLAYDADKTGRVTMLTDGIEAARVILDCATPDLVDGFVVCPVPDWAAAVR